MVLIYYILAALFGLLAVFGLLLGFAHVRARMLLRANGYRRVRGGWDRSEVFADPSPGCWLLVLSDYEKEGIVYRVTVISRGLLPGELIMSADPVED